jgi:hypothetical protein
LFYFSALLETKYFGLQILDHLIQTRWKALPREQCEGIKGYIVNLILEISSDSEKSERMKLLLQKLNIVLVQVLIYCFLLFLFSRLLSKNGLVFGPRLFPILSALVEMGSRFV